MSTSIRKTAIVPTMALVALLLATAPAAGGVDDFPGQAQREAEYAAARAWSSVDDVRAATGLYHDFDRASADGFAPWASDSVATQTCIGVTAGGEGIRYLRGLDGRVDPLQPEVMVYEPTRGGQPRLVAVEYVVPAMFVDDGHADGTTTLEVLGQPLRRHQTLPIYALRAWVWEDNPLGMFAEVNPNVSDCTPA